MASRKNGDGDYVSGEMLDIFFEFAEEDDFNEIFDNELNLAVDEVGFLLYFMFINKANFRLFQGQYLGRGPLPWLAFQV